GSTSIWSASQSAGGRVWGVILSSWSRRPIVNASWTRIPARRRFPGRDQNVRARLVDPSCRVVDPEGPEAKPSGLPVEKTAEHAWRVEAGHAQPVDRSIRGHERAGVAVGQERIVGDRRERRGCGRTLFVRFPVCLPGRRSVLDGAHIVTRDRGGGGKIINLS